MCSVGKSKTRRARPIPTSLVGTHVSRRQFEDALCAPESATRQRRVRRRLALRVRKKVGEDMATQLSASLVSSLDGDTQAAADEVQRAIVDMSNNSSRAHDLLEQGVYNTDTFLARCRSINDRTLAKKKTIKELSASVAVDELRAVACFEIIPKAEHVLDVYSALPNAQAKNTLLKDVVDLAE